MSLRWCGITAVLLAAVVVFTLVQIRTSQEEPGITRRWWDGSIEKIERRYSDGTLYQRTFYGDDGASVLRDEVYSSGRLSMLRVRLPDGTMEVRTYDYDNKLSSYVLKTPDERFNLIKREYYSDGKLKLEEISSKDGSIVLENRKWFQDGSLEREETVSPAGDVNLVEYWSKDVLKTKQVQHINGTGERIDYRSDGKTISRKRVDTAEAASIETYTYNGTLKMIERHDRKTKYITFTVFQDDGKTPQFKQSWKPYNARSNVLDEVEVYDKDGKLARKLFVTGRDEIRTVNHYRPDGSLKSVRHLRANGTVSSEDICDEKGNITDTKKYGDDELREEIDPGLTRLLQTRREFDE